MATEFSNSNNLVFTIAMCLTITKVLLNIVNE